MYHIHNVRFLNIFHHEVEEPDEVLILFGYYSQIEYVHLPTVFPQRLVAADLVESLLYLEFWPLHSRCCRLLPLRV